MSKILTIAIPSRGNCSSYFAQTLTLLQKNAFDKYECLTTEGADIAMARSVLIEQSTGDSILFLDDDVLPPINAITKLASHDKDIVTGLYFAKQQPHFPQIFKKNAEDPTKYDAVFDVEEDKLIEVDACGAGILLIKREVFKKLKRPFFQYEVYGEETSRKGEDFYFCEKAKEAGFSIYCDTSVLCGHRSTNIITPEYWQISKQKLKDMEEKMGKEKFDEFKKKYWQTAGNFKKQL